MFCKKCGREIKENVKFCPGCGTAVMPSLAKTSFVGSPFPSSSAGLSPLSPSGPLAPGTVPVTGTEPSLGGSSRSLNIGKYIIVSAITLVLAAMMAVIVFLVLRLKFGGEAFPEEKYSVIGTWSSDDLGDLGDLMEDILYDNLRESLGSSEARSVSESVNRLLDDFSGRLEIVFRDNGALELYVSNVSLEVISLSYEIIDESEMKLTMSFPTVSISISTLSMEIPPISYKAGYDLGEKQMTLDFFGHELEFTRKK